MSDIKSTPSTGEAWRADARYFREMTEGWAFAAAVACSVAPGNGNGNRRERDTSGKVSARAFAREAGTSADRVLRYLRVWAKAAEMGFVEPADTLTPGSAETVELPPEEVEWSGMVIVANADAAADVKPIPAKSKQALIPAPLSVLKDRKGMIKASIERAAHIVDATLNMPNVSDADLAEVEKYAAALATLASNMKKKIAAKRAAVAKKAQSQGRRRHESPHRRAGHRSGTDAAARPVHPAGRGPVAHPTGAPGPGGGAVVRHRVRAPGTDASCTVSASLPLQVVNAV